MMRPATQLRGCHIAPGIVMGCIFWYILEHFGIRGPLITVRPANG